MESEWDIHYLDQLLAQLEAKHQISKPIMIHAILETALGVENVAAIAGASKNGLSPKAISPIDQ